MNEWKARTSKSPQVASLLLFCLSLTGRSHHKCKYGCCESQWSRYWTEARKLRGLTLCDENLSLVDSDKQFYVSSKPNKCQPRAETKSGRGKVELKPLKRPQPFSTLITVFPKKILRHHECHIRRKENERRKVFRQNLIKARIENFNYKSVARVLARLATLSTFVDFFQSSPSQQWKLFSPFFVCQLLPSPAPIVVCLCGLPFTH